MKHLKITKLKFYADSCFTFGLSLSTFYVYETAIKSVQIRMVKRSFEIHSLESQQISPQVSFLNNISE